VRHETAALFPGRFGAGLASTVVGALCAGGDVHVCAVGVGSRAAALASGGAVCGDSHRAGGFVCDCPRGASTEGAGGAEYVKELVMLGRLLAGFLGGNAGRIFGIALLAIGAFISAWKVQSWRYEARIAALHSTHAQALAVAEQAARAIEHQRLQDMERLTDETEQKLAAVASRERRAADERVRNVAARYAERQRQAAERAAPAASCETSAAAARMLAELLGELDELAQVYAREADRARVAGLACEAGYESLRP